MRCSSSCKSAWALQVKVPCAGYNYELRLSGTKGKAHGLFFCSIGGHVVFTRQNNTATFLRVTLECSVKQALADLRSFIVPASLPPFLPSTPFCSPPRSCLSALSWSLRVRGEGIWRSASAFSPSLGPPRRVFHSFARSLLLPRPPTDARAAGQPASLAHPASTPAATVLPRLHLPLHTLP